MEIRTLQLEELKILKETIKICEQHNLSYFVLGGTFLGAVRHKGFIPWDDDIDIGMPRNDYEQFISFAQTELPSSYEIKNFYTDDKAKNYCTKLIDRNISILRTDSLCSEKQNLWIDIFPLDGMPNNFFVRKLHMVNLLFHRLLLQYSKINSGVNIKKKRNFIEFILIKCGFLISKVISFDTKKCLIKIDWLLKKYDYSKSKYIVNFMGAYKFKEMFPRSYYETPALYDFEDIKVFGSSEYDKILTQMYGSYMNPPEENQRFSHSITQIRFDNKN
ncbi:MAG: LicD family protein [Treponema sp.]|nr:LicD family protein [Treponema sp.]